MANPTIKHPNDDRLLDRVLDPTGRHKDVRVNAIKGDVCIPKPIGCGGPAVEFSDELSVAEYRISGLCQKCQDSVFGPDPDTQDPTGMVIDGCDEYGVIDDGSD